MNALIRQLVLFVVLPMCCAHAHAHAFLERAQPAVGSTVRGSPGEIKLWFTSPLEPAFSTLRVLDMSGRQVDNKDKRVDRSDPALMKITVPPLGNGTYRVIWHVLSVDTHVTEGDFTFEVAP